MKMITLPHDAIYTGPLILVNRQHPVRANYLSSIRLSAMDTAVTLESTAANLLAACLEAIGSGGKLAFVSGYRTHAEQVDLYEKSIIENGPVFTKKYVAQPGASEHETGLAIDLGLNSSVIDFIRPAFPNEGICAKFAKNATKYGFIRRYIEEKQLHTGIAEEPWHFRYVGRPHAQIMKELGLCLEEYIAFLKNFKYMGKHYITSDNGRSAEVFYVRAGEKETILSMPDSGYFQISGNNDDGFIVTYWR